MSQLEERSTIREDGLIGKNSECRNGFEQKDNLMNEEDIYLKVNPMLKEASLWLQFDHDHVQELNLHDNIRKDCTSSFGEASSFHGF